MSRLLALLPLVLCISFCQHESSAIMFGEIGEYRARNSQYRDDRDDIANFLFYGY